jgi:hypothetical protein
MNKKDTIFDEISDIKKEISSYIQNKLDLSKLHLAEELSRFVSNMATKIVLLNIFLFALFFLSVALGIAIGKRIESYEMGFIFVSGGYILIALLIYVFKGFFIQTPIIKSFIQLFFPNYKKYDKE